MIEQVEAVVGKNRQSCFIINDGGCAEIARHDAVRLDFIEVAAELFQFAALVFQGGARRIYDYSDVSCMGFVENGFDLCQSPWLVRAIHFTADNEDIGTVFKCLTGVGKGGSLDDELRFFCIVIIRFNRRFSFKPVALQIGFFGGIAEKARFAFAAVADSLIVRFVHSKAGGVIAHAVIKKIFPVVFIDTVSRRVGNVSVDGVAVNAYDIGDEIGTAHTAFNFEGVDACLN